MSGPLYACRPDSSQVGGEFEDLEALNRYSSPPNSVEKMATCLSSRVYRAVEMLLIGGWVPFGWLILLEAAEEGRTDDLLRMYELAIVISARCLLTRLVPCTAV